MRATCLVGLLMVLVAGAAPAQEVQVTPDPTRPLAERWAWAASQGPADDDDVVDGEFHNV